MRVWDVCASILYGVQKLEGVQHANTRRARVTGQLQMCELPKQKLPHKQFQKEVGKVEKNPSKSDFYECQGLRSKSSFRMPRSSYNDGTGTQHFVRRKLCTIAWVKQPGIQRQGRAHCFESRTEGRGNFSRHKQAYPNKLQESFLDAHIQGIQVQD
jgi:hypothetical protein